MTTEIAKIDMGGIFHLAKTMADMPTMEARDGVRVYARNVKGVTYMYVDTPDSPVPEAIKAVSGDMSEMWTWLRYYYHSIGIFPLATWGQMAIIMAIGYHRGDLTPEGDEYLEDCIQSTEIETYVWIKHHRDIWEALE